MRWIADTGVLNRVATGAMGTCARWLGTLWVDMGKIGGRWSEVEAAANKRAAVLTVEAFGMAQPAMDLARHVSIVVQQKEMTR